MAIQSHSVQRVQLIRAAVEDERRPTKAFLISALQQCITVIRHERLDSRSLNFLNQIISEMMSTIDSMDDNDLDVTAVSETIDEVAYVLSSEIDPIY